MPDATLQQWGANLRNRRLERGLTLKEIAAAVAVSEATVCRWEYGHHEPKARHRAALAAALDVQPGDLFPLEAH
jgi:transcriptional regulator with XRE-family HTH domain